MYLFDIVLYVVKIFLSAPSKFLRLWTAAAAAAEATKQQTAKNFQFQFEMVQNVKRLPTPSPPEVAIPRQPFFISIPVILQESPSPITWAAANCRNRTAHTHTSALAKEHTYSQAITAFPYMYL